MKPLLMAILLLCFAGRLRAEVEIEKNSYSPNKCFAIAGTGGDYYFIDVRTGKKIGSVIPAAQSGDEGITNIAFDDVTWDGSSAHLALVLYYGTRGVDLLLYARDAAGSFDLLKFNPPDPLAIFIRGDSKWKRFQYAFGYDEYSVGRWSHHSVNLISGALKQTDDGNSVGFFATYKVTVHKTVPMVSEMKLIGPLQGDEATGYLDKWKAINRK
jgi:hypothetical protein